MSEKVILEMKDIVKDYSGFKAVDHVDFSLHNRSHHRTVRFGKKYAAAVHQRAQYYHLRRD